MVARVGCRVRSSKFPKKTVCIYDANEERRLEMTQAVPQAFFVQWNTDSLGDLAEQLDNTDIILAHDSNTKIVEIVKIMETHGIFVPLCAYARYPKHSRMIAQIKHGVSDYFLLPVTPNFTERLLLACGNKKKVFRPHPKASQKQAGGTLPIQLLSRRELEIAKCLAKGLTSIQISYALGITRPTVDTHAYRIYSKLGVNGRVDLMQLKLEILEEGERSAISSD